MCLPQYDKGERGEIIKQRSTEQNKEFASTLNNMHILYLGLKVFIFMDAQYMGRFWPCWESWNSMRVVCNEGLVAMTPACTPRFSIRCLHSAMKAVTDDSNH